MHNSSFRQLLRSSESWSAKYTCDEISFSDQVSQFLFDKPCSQFDIPSSVSLDNILSLLHVVCAEKGECLTYDDSPFLKLPDYTEQIAEWHYDGISNLNPLRVPDWLFLIHSGDLIVDSPQIQDGFGIANCHLLYINLSPKGRALADQAEQVIFGHKVGTSNTKSKDKADLRVRLVDRSTLGFPVFRGHFPLPSTFTVNHSDQSFYCFPDDLSFRFIGLSFDDQQFLLNDIHSALSTCGVTFHHRFDCHSLLAVHNKSCFHSAYQVQAGGIRPVFRLQLIEAFQSTKS